MAEDAELQAMSVVIDALADLTPEARARVLSWAANRYSMASTAAPATNSGPSEPVGKATSFRDFADLFDAASPETEVDKALVAAYWFQVEQGHDDWEAQVLHDALKDLGQRITNITRALTNAQQRKPALVRQLQKSGRTQQARKTYRMTTQGVRSVQSMFSL